jgi:hypothetical protein
MGKGFGHFFQRLVSHGQFHFPFYKGNRTMVILLFFTQKLRSSALFSFNVRWLLLLAFRSLPQKMDHWSVRKGAAHTFLYTQSGHRLFLRYCCFIFHNEKSFL